MKIAITLTAEPQRISDLMVAAIEGGIDYWAEDVTVHKDGERVRYSDAESFEGDWLVRGKYPLDDEGDEMGEFQFTAAEFAERVGLAPQSLTEWLVEENEDANSADVLFQVAAFGEVVFG